MGRYAASTAELPDEFEIRSPDGAILTLRVHGRRATGPRLVLSHGNGLAIDGYESFWRPLAACYEIVVFDMRNHGRNPTHDPAAHRWENFTADLEAVWQAVGHPGDGRPVIGVFHSLSAITALLHVFAYRPRWDGLLLFDPPLLPGDDGPLRDGQIEEMATMSARAERRTERFADPADLVAQFARQAVLSRWRPEAYDQMARAVLRPDPAGDGWVLSCPRALEAWVFRNNADPTVWSRLGQVPVPFKLVCADPDLWAGTMAAKIGADVAERFGVAYEFVPDTTHFLQIENPAACLAAVTAFCDGIGTTPR